MREPLFGPDGGDHLLIGIELHPELASVEIGNGLTEFRDAFGGRVAMVAGVAHGFGQLLNRHVRRRQVGVAKSQVNGIAASSTGL